MKRMLYAVKSCKQDMDNGCHRRILDTWGKHVGFPLRFFIGGDCVLDINDNETQLGCADLYDDLPHKTKAILKYSLDRDFDGVFLSDTDTYIIPEKLEALHFWDYDYFGVIRKPPEPRFPYLAIDRENNKTSISDSRPWASGGLGYYVSANLAKAIVDNQPNLWAEDWISGQVAHKLWDKGEITIHDSKDQENICTWHSSAFRLDMVQMYRKYR